MQLKDKTQQPAGGGGSVASPLPSPGHTCFFLGSNGQEENHKSWVLNPPDCCAVELVLNPLVSETRFHFPLLGVCSSAELPLAAALRRALSGSVAMNYRIVQFCPGQAGTLHSQRKKRAKTKGRTFNVFKSRRLNTSINIC